MSKRYDRSRVLEGGCPVCTSEEAIVTVPASVSAFANVGNVEICCSGAPVITRNSDVTPGIPGAISRFTISQRLRVDVPVVFGAQADVGEGHVCFTSSRENSDECGCTY